MLAETIAKDCGRPVAYDALKRIKATAQQVGLTRAQRADNIQGAFRVPAASKAAVAGRRLILVDDVLTTGATASEAAETLERAGALGVSVITFARALPDRRRPGPRPG
jgi:predicted amidophosphoribosyltransferase